MEICKSAYAGNEYVGLYAKASDSFALIPKSSPQKFEERAKCLNAKVVKASVCGSPYLGVYMAVNSEDAGFIGRELYGFRLALNGDGFDFILIYGESVLAGRGVVY